MINEGRLQEAEHHARTLLQSQPDSGMLWKVLGVALGLQGQDPLPALRRAAELLPDDAEAHRNLGAALHERGQLEEALPSLRRSLQIMPRDVAVLLAAGNALCALGRVRESLEQFERALEIDPHLPEAHNNLGNALQELGQSADAVACYRRALLSQPDDAETLCNLSNALRQLGQLDEALSSSRRAVALAPRMSLAHNNLGLALAALGQREQAVASLREAARLNPRLTEAWNNLGNVLRDLGQHGEALGCYRQAVELLPQRAESHCNLGDALYECGEVAEATVSYRRALELRPGYPPAQLGLSAALRLQGRIAEAEDSSRAVLASDPNSAAALALLGDLCTDRGEFAQAHELFQRALSIDADSAPVFCSIAAHRKMTSADTAWLQGAETLLAKGVPVSHEIALRHALGKYHDDLRQYDAAFSQYRTANVLARRCGPEYDRENVTEQVDATIRRFDSAFVHASHPGESASELPLFIIGMPRSGTTLTEQILASHPQVFGVGEVQFWDSAAELFTSSGMRGATLADAFATMAHDYLERVTTSSAAALRVVDKMPANFLHAGLIHAVFPRARIVHMQRHPIDTCLSIYFQNFVGMRGYATDLDDLAHYYREYVRITRHWRAVLPATTLLEIPYEALIADQELWTRRLLDFVGLPWDPRCLDFHRTQRVVITASRWQVRQKLGTASVGRWRNYERYVGPLRQLVELVSS